MDLRQLEYFARIVERGSFSSAARELGIAQPALSKRVAALEAELGARLLVRTARGTHATEAGADFFQHAVAILRQVESARRGAAGEKGAPAGPVAVGMVSSLAPLFGVPLMADVARNLPGVRLHLAEALPGELIERAQRGALDLAVVPRDTPPRDMLARALFSEDLFLASTRRSHGGRGEAGDTVRLRDAAGEPLLLVTQRLPLREQIESAFASLGAGVREQLKVVGEFDTVHSLRAAAEMGLGTAILPWSALAASRDVKYGLEGRDARHGSLRVARIVAPRLPRTAFLCASAVLPLSPAARAVLELVPGTVRRVLARIKPRLPEAMRSGARLVIGRG